MKVTNNSKALQGVNVKSGTVYIKPGQTRDVELTKAQAERAGRLKFLALKGEPVEDDPAQSVAGVIVEGKDGVYLKAEEFNTMREQFEALQAENERLREENDDLRNQLEKKPEQPSAGYTVVDKGRGWFVVTKDGQEVTKSLREDDVKGFADMSADDQAAFVDLHKPE